MRMLKRRRQEGKTDYRTRLELLKSGMPRLVIRKTNRFIIAQIIESANAQDKVIIGISSSNLLQYAWKAKGSLKSRPAAYLTGFLLASQAATKGIKKAVLDIGMHRTINKSRLYSVVKGATDAGLSIPCDSSVLPTEKELSQHPLYIHVSKVKEAISHGRKGNN